MIAQKIITLTFICNLLVVFTLGQVSPQGTKPAAQGNPYPSEWTPNQASSEGHYLGSNACLKCHKDKVSQQITPMAKALELADTCQILRSNAVLTFRDKAHVYKLVREGSRSIYTVTDGVNTFSAPILYCFGQGEAGQTYVFEHAGSLYESRVSFYNAIRGLDITLGHSREAKQSVDEAAGSRLTPAAARNCFGCHSTAAAGKSKLQLDRLVAGVTCESCHGPGETHVAAMKSGKLEATHIFNPSSLDSEGISNFCGSCHRTWEDVAQMILDKRKNKQELGINSIRFQPYRIANSRCYNMDDKRISCTACHDPHKDLQRDLAFYDAKCTACHSSNSKSGLAGSNTCPVARQKCVTCHMPKYDLPGSHFKFTDHRIRVVRPDESVW